jgi:hypothetical protein
MMRKAAVNHHDHLVMVLLVIMQQSSRFYAVGFSKEPTIQFQTPRKIGALRID